MIEVGVCGDAVTKFIIGFIETIDKVFTRAVKFNRERPNCYCVDLFSHGLLNGLVALKRGLMHWGFT